MFQGSIPPECLTQLFKVVPLERWSGVQVCCSGSFRIEASIRQRFPDLPLFGNDVSLLSCAMGALACGDSLPFRFSDRLAFLEEALVGADYARRVAALAIAVDLSPYRGDNDYARRHFAWFVDHVEELLDKVTAQMRERVAPLGLLGFFRADWRGVMRAAVSRGLGIIGFPPLAKNAYESLYRFLDANTAWERPAYAVYDPATLGDELAWLADEKADWCVVSDQDLPDLPRFGKLQKGRAKPYYLYGQSRHSTLRVIGKHVSESFRYVPVDLARITEKTEVRVAKCRPEAIVHLKDVFLAKNIIHAAGLFEFVVFLDDMLLGVLSLTLSKVDYFNLKTLYLQSDMCLSSAGKLSKLLCKLTLSQETITPIDHRLFERHRFVVTTAFSKHPVSMKYRGVFELIKRTPLAAGFQLQYGHEVIPDSHQDCFAWWWANYGAAACPTS